MEDMNYSDKELAIFKGVITLIRNGENLYSVTVSEIAQSSGVGKGTIYDYFTTKEEAISKSILYNIAKETTVAINRVELYNSFEDRYYEALKIIVENFNNKFSTINILLSTGSFDELYGYIIDEKHIIPKYISRIEDVIDGLLQMGYEEELLSIDESSYYKRMVITNSIAGFINYINHRGRYPDITIEHAMDLCYKIIIKSLN